MSKDSPRKKKSSGKISKLYRTRVPQAGQVRWSLKFQKNGALDLYQK